MLGVWKELQRIRREYASLTELPVAQLSALTANINRDPKKGQAFTAVDFCMFREAERSNDAFAPEVAEVALMLKHDDTYPPLLLAVWPQILASAKAGAKVPEVRALRSDDEAVWVLAPKWEGRNCRGGLVLVRGHLSGVITLRDLDRPLVRHQFVLPERPGFGWIEAGHLLLATSET